MIRGTFRCDWIESAGTTPTARKVVLTPRHDKQIPEPERLSPTDPRGHVSLIIDNPALFDASVPHALVVGRFFDLTLTPTEEPGKKPAE